MIPSNEREEPTMTANRDFYRLNIDEVFSNLSLGTRYDIGGEGHDIIVEGENLADAICEIVNHFKGLIEDSFELDYEEEEEEEE
jgi:hypothetical protein